MKYWIHISEHQAHHISIEAPSLEAAQAWAEDGAVEFIYAVARPDDETISCDVETVEPMTEDEAKDNGTEVYVDENGLQDTSRERAEYENKKLRLALDRELTKSQVEIMLHALGGSLDGRNYFATDFYPSNRDWEDIQALVNAELMVRVRQGPENSSLMGGLVFFSVTENGKSLLRKFDLLD